MLASMACRLGPYRIALIAEDEPGVASRWTESYAELEVSVITAGSEDHDTALGLLLCLGRERRVVWDRATISDGPAGEAARVSRVF
jgi:hypothetical protein